MEPSLTTSSLNIAASNALEKKVQNILNDILSVTAIEEAFAGFLIYSEEEEQNKKKICFDIFCQFWKAHASKSGEAVLNIYVSHMFKQHSQRISILFEILSYCVEKGLILPKLVCDAVLSHPGLDYKSKEIWRRSFQLIYGIILKHIDYKGCRDLLKILLEKVQLIPAAVNIAYKNEMSQIKRVIALILDRQNFLLPAYFAVTEIQMIFPDNSPEASHWIVGEMLGAYVESFRAVARMALITGRPHLLPVIGHSNTSGNAWKLDQHTLTFALKGNLPFDKDQLRPQYDLIRYALKQPYSRDMVCTIISLNKQQKQRSAVLEEQLAELVVFAMERSEQDVTPPSERYGTPIHALWQHLSSQLIIFALFQFVNFPDVVELLFKKLKGKHLTKGRDYLMWLLLQFISGSMKKSPLQEFLPILKLFDLLYQEKEPLPVPDVNFPSCVQEMAMACIWPHLQGKAALEKKSLPCPLPKVLHLQHEFLRKTCKTPNLPLSDYRIALMCNAYSTTTDLFQAPLNILTESFYNPKSSPVLLPGPSNNMAAGPIEPLSIMLLDSLSTHTKLSFIHHIATKISQLAARPMNLALSPAMMETYSRLLVYVELESLGIKILISQVYNKVVDSHAWGSLHSLLELINYRIHHIQPHYRIQLLCSLHSLSNLPQTNHNQLYHCIESTALKIITSLGSSEVQPQLSRFHNDPKQLLSTESEELNRALVLTLARAIHVTGSETLSGTWCRGILEKLQTNTPHNWASHTLKCFPSSLQQFFEQNMAQTENRAGLKELVDESFRNWSALGTDQDKVAYFTGQGVSPFFLCIVWKILLETEHIPGIIVKILEQMGPGSMSAQIRCFADYLVQEFSTSAGGQHINKCVEKLNDMVWKLNIVTLDKLVLCLALRSHEGNEAQVCFFIIQLLILKPNEFRSRVIDFVKDNSPEHWTQSDWHTQHMAYHKNYPENFFYEGLCEKAGTSFSNPPKYYPVYFSNVCLRFLPVFDILIHRFIELPPVSKSLETLLEHLGNLFKFHDRPVTYLYNTLHYYERKLTERPHLKKKLVGAIIGAQKMVKPAGWCLSPPFLEYLNRHGDEANTNWEPTHTYFFSLIARLVDTMGEKPAFPNFDWRFNEFPNANTHALYVTCMELMALPCKPDIVGKALLDILLKNHVELPRSNIMGWINAIALVLTSLPEVYCEVIQEHILETLTLDHQMMDSIPASQDDLKSIFAAFDFTASYTCKAETLPAYLMAITHAVWHHSNIGQLTLIPRFLKEQIKPVVKTEGQFLFVCSLIGPLLQRFHEERTRCLMEIAVEIYEMLGNVDRNCPEIIHVDTICDFLYHIKYRFAGDSIKTEAEQVIRGLKPQLSKGLRFISKSKTPVSAGTPEDPASKLGSTHSH
ncbi:Mediator of RNA polymerase II transcription subunit 23 [Holothuria leucospilota]|uniref:Mediator of RNA polymerase II transcription subunit 23 n=1 Tax=Holothuria leucospilota TaxID=206669 RepID=A0A9Q1H5Z5_HOLLE|nr:Mediator of RNA polymerase II transcription subunit 23 [Holothuria leucospilota]